MITTLIYAGSLVVVALIASISWLVYQSWYFKAINSQRSNEHNEKVMLQSKVDDQILEIVRSRVDVHLPRILERVVPEVLNREDSAIARR